METRTVSEQWGADAREVTSDFLRNAGGYYGHEHDKAHSRARLAVDVAERPFADPAALATVASWVVTDLDFESEHRPLTASESAVRAAAQRLLDAAELLGDLGRLCDAIASDDIDEALRLWERLQPHQAVLVSLRPDLTHLDALVCQMSAKTDRPPVHH